MTLKVHIVQTRKKFKNESKRLSSVFTRVTEENHHSLRSHIKSSY